MSTVTKPIALDETLQSTNTALSSLGKDTTLQAIATAIANVGLSNIGNMSSLVTTDKTSLVSAINEVMGDVSDLDTDKAEKVASATNGNLAGLNASGNLTDSGWASDKTTTSASGNPISITGLKSNQLAVNPVITFEPIQAGSGDPSPSNVRAISGYDKIEVLSCARNLYADSPNIQITSARYIGINLTKILPAGTYTVSAQLSSDLTTSGRVSFRNINGRAINLVEVSYVAGGRGYGTVTLSENAYALYFYYSNTSSGSGNRTWSNIQIELGESASNYEPYHKTTDLSENLPQTVYGGSLDVRTGVLTVTHGIKDMGDLTWYYTTNNVFYSENDIGAAKKDGITCVCSCYNAVANIAGTGAMTTDKTIALMNSTTNYNRIYVKETSYSDATAFKTAVTGQKLVYELATPTEIQLTPHEISLLKDYAYVSTNGTSMSFDYHNGEIATLGDVSQLGETVNELGDIVNDAESLDNAAINSLKQTGVTVAYGGLTKVGRMVSINVDWAGNISGNSPIITVPEKFRPSNTFYGGHMVFLTSQNSFISGLAIITSDGKLYDGTTSDAKTKGLINISYYI